MGVGRGQMNKLFIDDIKKKGEGSSPGPGKYTENRNFGGGLSYQMGARLNTE